MYFPKILILGTRTEVFQLLSISPLASGCLPGNLGFPWVPQMARVWGGRKKDNRERFW